MNLHENSYLGRKVFFAYPPYYITNTIIPKLSEAEYEVYVINQYQKIKPILQKFPDSICFFNIDADDLTYTEWFRFIKTFEEDEVLSTIFFGVLSQHAPKIHRERFMTDIQLPAGFIQYIPDLPALTDRYIKILELNGALGKRKYIRADCGFNRSIFVDLEVSGVRIPLILQNISSVGLSCYANKTHLPYLSENSVHRAVFHLGSTTFTGSVIILMKREVQERSIVVMLFSQGLSYSSRNIIREFIRDKMQENLLKHMEGIPLDSRDYSDNSEEAIAERNRENAPSLEAATEEEAKKTENQKKESSEDEKTKSAEGIASTEPPAETTETSADSTEAPAETTQAAPAEEVQEAKSVQEDSEPKSE